MASDIKPLPVTDPLPSVGEHGVNGYTNSAVGGFGAGYAAQVAHGAEGDALGAASDSELDSKGGPTKPGTLEHAVLKALARAHIDAADLRVEAAGAEIRLHGTVRHLAEKVELESRARAVPGVGSIVSELTVLRSRWQNP